MNLHDQQFIRGIESGDRNLVKTAPKSDLHCHTGLGFKKDVLEQQTGRKINPSPSQMYSLREMNQWISDELKDLYTDRRSVEFALRAALMEAVDDGITLLEMSIDVSFISHYENDPDKFARMILECSDEVAGMINFRPELGVARDMDPKVALPLASACLDTKVFSCIDLYGTENAQPPEVYKDLYCRAKKGGVKCKVHLGEFGSAENLLNASQILAPDAIQHGIAAADSEVVMRWLAEKNITLNICPTSNIRLSRVKDYTSHPIGKLYEAGVSVTINSDDIMVFGQNVTDEYFNLFNAGTLNALELNIIRNNGLSQ